MSWHPYERNSRLWTIYWGEQPTHNTVMHLLEMTEPYCMTREEWSEVQLRLLVDLVPADFFINVSQLWSRNWPTDAQLRFSHIHDNYKLPHLLSQDCYRNEQPRKREGFFWVMTQTKPNYAALENVLCHQAVDFENITWITRQPIEPFPDQLFEFNKVALGWYNKEVSETELNQVILEEAWGLFTTNMSHLSLRVPDYSLTSEQIWQVIERTAVEYDLQISKIANAEKPQRPALIKTLAAAPVTMMADGLSKFNRGFKK